MVTTFKLVKKIHRNNLILKYQLDSVILVMIFNWLDNNWEIFCLVIRDYDVS